MGRKNTGQYANVHQGRHPPTLGLCDCNGKPCRSVRDVPRGIGPRSVDNGCLHTRRQLLHLRLRRLERDAPSCFRATGAEPGKRSTASGWVFKSEGTVVAGSRRIGNQGQRSKHDGKLSTDSNELN